MDSQEHFDGNLLGASKDPKAIELYLCYAKVLIMTDW
jgi:hypothetical protein